LAFELLNSAIECLLDYLHPRTAPQIKLAKDVAAAAVLIMSVGAICVGGLMIIASLNH
jgi:undecaprenol kinase